MNRTTVLILSLALLVPTVSLSGQGEEGGPGILENDLVAVAEVRCAGLDCVFDASGSTAPPDADYHWDFGDGNTDTAESTSHSYTTPDYYIVSLTVEDTEGNTSTHHIAHVVHPFGFDLDDTASFESDWTSEEHDHPLGHTRNLWRLLDPTECEKPAPVGDLVLAFTDECSYNGQLIDLANYRATGWIESPSIPTTQFDGLDDPELWFATTWELGPCSTLCLEPIAAVGQLIYPGDRDAILRLEVSADGGAWEALWDNDGDREEEWHLVRVPLADYKTAGEIRLRFVFDNLHDKSETDHFGWFIDRIRVDDSAAVAPVADASLTQRLVHTIPDASDGTILLDGGLSAYQGERPEFEWTRDGGVKSEKQVDLVDLPPGVHDLVLTITDSGAISSDTVEVHVNRVPVADTQGTDTLVHVAPGDQEGEVLLDAPQSTDLDDDEIVGYIWSLDGAPIATGETATVVLDTGLNMVTLEVEDEHGGVGETTVEILVNRAPIADPEGTEELVHVAHDAEDGEVVLDASNSEDLDGDTLSFQWFLDDQLISTDDVTTETLPVGLHTLTLKVEDEHGAESGTSVDVHVNRVPVADTTGTQHLIHIDSDAEDGEVLLDASLSTDLDGDEVVGFIWSLDGAPIATGETATVVLDTGLNMVTLEVEDEHGGVGETTVEILVNRAPIADPEGTEELVHVAHDAEDGEVVLDASNSEDLDGDTLSFQWFLDDQLISTDEVTTETLPVGIHTITLIVEDDHEAEDVTTVEVRVNRRPVADTEGTDTIVHVPADAEEGEVQFNASVSFDPDEDVLTYEWYEDESLIGTGMTATAPLEVGVHTITLRVEDQHGGFDEVNVEIEVKWPFHEDFSGDPFGDGGWTAPDDPTNLWRILGSTECTTSGTGTPMLAFNENDCDYGTGSRVLGDAISPSMSLVFEDLETVNLTLVQRREVETTTREVDVMQLFISTDGGSSWDLLRQWDGRDGDSDGWESVDVSLDPYIGEDDVRFRFHFDSKNRFSNAFLGWVIDEIRIG